MNKYEILDIIDEGAYGIVWKALNRDNNTIVAIKEFKESDEDQISQRTIQREIKMLKMLKGEYIVQIKQAFKKKGKVYLIFQYFEKNILNLIQLYQQGLEPKLITKVIYMAVKCIHFLHHKNVIHRDIKPQNILINNTYTQLKLCDFGFARFYSESQELTQYVATRWYRSPELLVGQLYGKPADMWALGCILGQLVDGQPMFPGQNQMDQLFLIKKNLGALTPNQLSNLTTNPKFLGMNFPPLRKHQSLQNRYLGQIQKNALDFLKSCLQVDPSLRISADDALRHPYFAELSSFDGDLSNDQQNLLQTNRKKFSIYNKHQLQNFIKISQTKKSQPSIEAPLYGKDFHSKNNLRGNLASLPQQQLLGIQFSKQINTKMSKKKSEDNNFNSYNSNQYLITKKKLSNGSSPKLKFKKDTNKRLAKMMSQEKKLNLNVDVNVKINLKINPSLKALQANQLPQIKQSTKGLKFLMNLKNTSNKLLKPNTNLSILGQSKQLTKLNKKLDR